MVEGAFVPIPKRSAAPWATSTLLRWIVSQKRCLTPNGRLEKRTSQGKVAEAIQATDRRISAGHDGESFVPRTSAAVLTLSVMDC
jgi:hypothetical protein